MIGSDYSKHHSPKEGRRRSGSRERSRRDSMESVSYEKGDHGLDEVSIGVEWSGEGVSIHAAQQQENVPTECSPLGVVSLN